MVIRLGQMSHARFARACVDKVPANLFYTLRHTVDRIHSQIITRIQNVQSQVSVKELFVQLIASPVQLQLRVGFGRRGYQP